jgi:predicted dehydrogenase
MRALVAGLGSTGRRHVRTLAEHFPSVEIGVWRHRRPEPADDEKAPGTSKTMFSLAEVERWNPDIAFICTPAPTHVQIARELVGMGTHLFLEKPVSNEFSGVADLIQTMRDSKLVGMVGYQLRFYEPLVRLREAVTSGEIGDVHSVQLSVGQYLPDWRPGTDHRAGVSGRSASGGGVLLELSHEFDYLRWVFGEADSVIAFTRRTGRVTEDAEDLAEVTAKMRSGVVAQVHLDMLDRTPRRECRVIGSEGTLVLDWTTHSLRRYDGSTREWATIFEPRRSTPTDPYVSELKHFMECVEQGKETRIPLSEGLRSLELALAAGKSAATGKVVEL